MKNKDAKIYKASLKMYNISQRALNAEKAERFDDEFYSALKANFFGEPFGKNLKYERTSGKCYFYALFLAKSIKNSTLKLGALNKLNYTEKGKEKKFYHSWVEFDNTVYDTTLKMAIDKEEYYKKFSAEVFSSYEHSELENPVTFFDLGLNATKYVDYILFDRLYKVVIDDYNKNKDNFDKLLDKYGMTDTFQKILVYDKMYE